MLRERIELSTSPLPMECSTTELPQQIHAGGCPEIAENRTGLAIQRINAAAFATGWQGAQADRAGLLLLFANLRPFTLPDDPLAAAPSGAGFSGMRSGSCYKLPQLFGKQVFEGL